MPDLTLTVASGLDLEWATRSVASHHYLRSAPDRRSRPLCCAVRLKPGAFNPVGCLWFGRTESTCCYHGGLTYGGTEAVAAGRARYDRWEVLALSRLWLDPMVQAGGDVCRPEYVPGFTDRKGRWRSAVASAAIHAALARVGFDYLTMHPPCFLADPYQIRAVLSYCDTRRHRGTVYRAAGFALARRNAAGVETWWTSAVAPLTAGQDAAVRTAAEANPRSRRVRHAASQGSLFDK